MTDWNIPEHLQDIAGKLSEFPRELVKNHFELMDSEYFLEFHLESIRNHLSLIHGLGKDRLCRVSLTLEAGSLFKLDVAGRDVTGVFAMITGLLTSVGCDFISGRIFTYRTSTSPQAGSLPVYFVDHFHGKVLGPPWKAEEFASLFESELTSLMELLLANKRKQAQKYVHKKIGRFLSEVKLLPAETKLYPIQIASSTTGPYTVLHITGRTTRGFLFSLSNALTLKGMILHKLYINTENGQADDTFYITDKYGKPITKPENLNNLKTAIALIKQFTLLLPMAPDYDLAIRQFDTFLDRLMDQKLDASVFLESDKTSMIAAMVKAFGTGAYLWEEFVKLQSETLFPALRSLEELKASKHQYEMRSELTDLLDGVEDFDRQFEILNRYKDRELFRIDLLYLIYPSKTFFQFAEELSDLAKIVINIAVHLVRNHLTAVHGFPMYNERKCRFAVLALGKFGGRELGYGSDLEIVLVYEGLGKTDHRQKPLDNSEFFNLLVQQLCKSVKAKGAGIFQIDLRLRPHGNDGELANTLSYWEKYYSPSGQAYDYERQALIKLRPIYGVSEFSDTALQARDRLIYGEYQVGIDKTLTLREKQKKQHAEHNRINAKYSPGGLCEIEYGIQFLQLDYGRKQLRLRTESTIRALEGLLKFNIISPSEFETLYNCYAFHRRLINALRMVRGQAKDLYLPNPGEEEFSFLCRRLGYQAKSDQTPEQQLQADMNRTFKTVHDFFRTRFIEFSKQPFAEPGLPELLTQKELDVGTTSAILESISIKNPAQTSRLLRQMAGHVQDSPALIAVLVMARRYIRLSPSPDKVILNLHEFVTTQDPSAIFLKQMLFQPAYIEIAVRIFGYSDYLSKILVQFPYFLHYIASPVSFSSEKTRELYLAEIKDFTRTSDTLADFLEELRVYNQRELLRIGTRDIYLRTPLVSIVSELSNLADSLLRFVYTVVAREQKLSALSKRQCVIAMGKLGGHELNYSSDIDLVFIIEDDLKHQESSALEKLSRTFIRHLTHSSSHGKLFRVDTNLRPYGAQGSLTGNFTYYRNYYRNQADGWELQSWLKARVVAGSAALGKKITEVVHRQIWQKKRQKAIAGSLQEVRMKSLSAIPRDNLDYEIKQGPGGIRTVEFFLQAQQVKWGGKYPEIITGLTLLGLERLKQVGLLEEERHDHLYQAYLFLRGVEHSLQLEGMQQRSLLPHQGQELSRLARRMGYEDRLNETAESQLLTLYQQHTSFLKEISEELFPGSTTLGSDKRE